MLFYYFTFCLFVASMFVCAVYLPVIKEAALIVPNNSLVENKWTGAFIAFCIALLGAPALLLICIVPSIFSKFYQSLYFNIIND